MITTINEFKRQLKINEASRPASELEKEIFDFLNDLRLSGATNMYGAVPYIIEEYPDLDKSEASKLLGLWMKNFNENGDYDIINENNIEDMLHINLLDKYKETNSEVRQKFEEYKSKIKGFKTEHLALKAGDIIEFNGGYNNDIRYTTEILGFDEDGDIYLLWDSYWFPIRNEERRAIKLINNVNENVDNSLEPLYTVKDLELAFEAGVDSIEYDENHGYMNKSSFTDFLNSLNNNVNENKINLNNLTSGDKIVIYNKQSHITYNGEFVKIQNNRIYFKNLDHPSTDIHSFIISNNIEVSIKSKINENVDTTQLPKALEDIDERRPNRMKRPNASGYSNDFAGRGGVRGLVYIQDEAERIMQDKYGRERGTKMWKASINAPQRGAMFKMADDVMKEKMFLYHQAGIYPRNYWEVSYYALWKLWMESQGLSYKVDSDEDVANKKAEKERLEREENERKAQAIKDQKLKQFNDTVSNLIKDIDPAIKPDSKDMARIASTMSKNDPEKMAKVMASAIKDKNKAIRRGLAVIEWFKQNKPTDHYMLKWVAQPFLNKAKQL